MSNLKYSLGIDVSMKDFYCCLSVIDIRQAVRIKASHKFGNNLKGFALLMNWLAKHRKEDIPLAVTMEATGVYHEQLAWFLYGRKQAVSILLPNKAKKYLQADGGKSKNDSIDARGLSRIGAEKKLDTWTPPSPELYNLRCHTRQHQNLNELSTMLGNQLHSLAYSQFKSRDIVKQLEKTQKLLKLQIREMEQAIEKIVKSDPVLFHHYKNVTAIKGMAMLSFAVIAAETDGFALFGNASSLVSYAGYDVIENQSGKHSGKTKISKKGNSRIRRILMMPAFCAVRKDQPQFRNLYDRIYERTKIKMKAYVAVQKKLLIMMYYLWKKNEMYNPHINNPEKIVAPHKAGATLDEIQKMKISLEM